jgi:hypothetical protein
MSSVNHSVRVASVWGLPVFAALLASCSGLLGIEDVSTSGSGGSAALGGNGGNGGSGGSQNKGGSSATTGGASGVTGGSSAGGASTTGGSTASGGAPAGGKANETGGASTGGKNGTGGKTNTGGASATGGTSTGEAGEGGDGGGGGAGPTDTTVHGTIIDYYGHPVPDVPVTIGAETVQTDAQGKFTIADVAPTYDALFMVQPLGDESTPQPYTWLYEGLTRRDPTLQVFRAFQWKYGKLEYTITNGQFGNPPYTYISVGTPNGTYYDWADATSGSARSFFVTWAGPAAKLSGGLHALRFKSTDEAVATSFDAYYTQTVSLDASTMTTLSFALPAANPALVTGMVSGTVTSPSSSQRYNSVYARFSDNAVIPVVNGADITGEAFNYLVPSIPGAELTFAACYGYYYTDERSPLACAYQPASVGQNNLNVSIPSVPTLVAPIADATGISADASFQWASSASVFVFGIQDADYDNLRGVFVVTSKKQAKIPLVGGSYPLRKGFPQAWHVQVHSNVTSVDDAARPGGFLGSFAWRTAQPQIYRANDSGSFAQSATQLASPAN